MLGVEGEGKKAKENERAQKRRHWGGRGRARLNAPGNARGAGRAKSATQLTSRIDEIGSNVD